jgi:hypothetical protein
MRQIQLTEIRVDWQRAALNIRNHVSLSRASKMIGENVGFLAQIARDEMKTEPRFSKALKILDLHTELCGEEATKGLRQ